MKSPSPDITRDPRWASIVTRDKAADGSFWYSVATTGVFCRPSCPSRLANPKNVRLHESIGAAEAAGFRACRRCNPDGISIDAANAAIITKACRLIDEAAEPLSLTQLAEFGRAQPALLPPPLQEGHGPDAESLRGGRPLGSTAPGAGNGGDGHRGVSRGGLRVERAVLRGFGRRAGHEPDPLPVGRCPGSADLRRRPMLARRHPRRVERQGRRRHPAGGRSGGACCAISRTGFRGPDWWAATRPTSDWWPRWSEWSRSRRTASTCRSTFAARHSSSASGRRCAPSRRAPRKPTRASRDKIGARSFRAGRRRSVRGQRPRRGDPVPPRRAAGRRPLGLSLGSGAQARADRARIIARQERAA